MQCSPLESLPDPPGGNPPRGTIDPEKLGCLVQFGGYAHFYAPFTAMTATRTMQSLPVHIPVAGYTYLTALFVEDATPLIQITNGTRVYSVIISRSVTSIRPIDRECENVHSKRTQRRKTSWRTNRHSINRRSFAIAIAQFTS